MMWDMFCKAVEDIAARGLSPIEISGRLNRMAREARLFQVPETPPKCRDNLSFEKFLEMYEGFTLPFEVVAVEIMTGGRLILYDDGHPGMSGMGHERFFVYLSLVDNEARDSAYETAKTLFRKGDAEKLFADTVMVNTAGLMAVGVCHSKSFEDQDTQMFVFQTKYGYMLGKDKVLADVDMTKLLSVEGGAYGKREIGMSLGVAFRFLAVLQDKTMFVLEETPKRVRDPKLSRKIPRKHERPKYTIVTARQARETMRLIHPKKSGSKKSPHERRGHYRTLGSDYYKSKKGKKVWINHIWIGESESAVGNKRYKLLL